MGRVAHSCAGHERLRRKGRSTYKFQQAPVFVEVR